MYFFVFKILSVNMKDESGLKNCFENSSRHYVCTSFKRHSFPFFSVSLFIKCTFVWLSLRKIDEPTSLVQHSLLLSIFIKWVLQTIEILLRLYMMVRSCKKTALLCDCSHWLIINTEIVLHDMRFKTLCIVGWLRFPIKQ